MKNYFSFCYSQDSFLPSSRVLTVRSSSLNQVVFLDPAVKPRDDGKENPRNNSGKELIKWFLLPLIFIFFSVNSFAANKPFKVILDWFANPNHAPLFVAQQQGFYKKLGLNVQFISPADPADPPKLVAAGQADIAVTYEPQFMMQVAQGLPLVRVATLIPMPLDCLVVLKNSSIHSIKDLKGKRIGYSSASTANAMLKTMLAKYGMSIKDVKLINVHYDLAQALLSRKVDAITGAMRNFEPIEIALAGQTSRLFFPEDNGMPVYDELILVTNQKELNDPRLRKFLMALQEGAHYLVNHPHSSWTQFANHHPELKNAFNKTVWFKTVPYFALRPHLLDKTAYQKYAQFLEKRHYLSHLPALHDYAVDLYP